MQWMVSKSVPLSRTVTRSAPRVYALAFIPSLATFVLILLSVGSMTLTPRPGQESMLLPSTLFIGGVFVAGHILYLWLVERTIRSDGS